MLAGLKRFSVMLLVGVPLLAAGCTIHPPRVSTRSSSVNAPQMAVMQRQHTELAARFQELNSRAGSLDADNQRLQALLAQQQQQTSQLQSALRGSRDTVADLRNDAAKVRRLPPSFAGQGSVASDEVGYEAVTPLAIARIPGAEVNHDGNDIRIRLDGAQLFASGQASVKKTSKNSKLLDDLSAAIQSDYSGRRITVEGHTDSDPITRSRWKSNHELSLARAKAIFQALRRRGVSERQLSVAGFGSTRALADNRTKAGKSRNRRVEVVIHP